jgi:DoxX-like family
VRNANTPLQVKCIQNQEQVCMQTATETIAVSNKSVLAGRILSGLAAAFLLFDGVMKLFAPPVVREAFVRLGYPETKILGIGVLLIVCTIIYLIPGASIFGAILLTGYLGGAISTHVRVSDPLFSHVLFPAYIAVLLWVGLYLREPRLRALIPLKN